MKGRIVVIGASRRGADRPAARRHGRTARHQGSRRHGDRSGACRSNGAIDAAERPAPRAVDHHCSVDDLGRLLTTLVADPPEPTSSAVAPLLVIESQIAEGLFTVDDWWRLEQLSVPSGLNCPDCRSALYRLNDQRVLRFRCRSGHGFSAESLLSGQSDARGNLLSSLFGALLEEATLARELLRRPEYAGDEAGMVPLRQASARLELQADQVWTWMRETAGLVEPEPSDSRATA